MPPRSTRKTAAAAAAAAAAKKQSPRLKKSTPRPSISSVVDADDADPAAEITPTAEEDEEPKPSDEEEEVAVEKVGEGPSETPSEAVEGGDADEKIDPKEMDVDNEVNGGDVQESHGEDEEIDAKDDKDDGAVETPSETIKGGGIEESHGEDEEINAKVKEMDSNKEVDEQLVDDEMGEGKVENVHAHVAEEVGIVEGTTRVCVDSDEINDEENEEKTNDKEIEERPNDKENEEEVDDKESNEEADDEESEEEVDDKESEEEVDDKESEEEADDKESEEEAEADNEDDPALYAQASLAVRKKEKNFEIFVGGLDRAAVEDDLIKVFGALGEIQSVRIVKHPVTQKSKGFAFVRYASMEHARKVLMELKNGTEVKGKTIRISASDDNDTLYLGNICKTWTKDQVIETLRGYGIDQIEDMLLPNDPKIEGRIKGFCFLEFASHSDAMSAFQRLRKPDAVFGRDVSAKVSFAQTPLHPSEESLLQVRTVYLEGIPESWDEGKVVELCQKHGEIEKIQLPKIFSSSRRKDFGFVEFSSRDAALACVEGINNAQFGEGDVNVKANLAKPTYKGRLARQSARGGYKVTKDGEATEAVDQCKKKKKAKSKVVHDMEETQPKLKNSNGSKPPSSQGKGSNGRKGKMSKSYKGIKRGRQGTDMGTSEQPSKRTRKNQKLGNMRGRPSSFGNKRRSYSHQIMHAPSYATPAANYTGHAYAGASGSHYHRSDLEPHAGFLPAAQQVRNPYEHDPRRAAAYASQLRASSGYAGAPMSQTTYPQYSSYAGYQVGYTYPNYGVPGYRGPHQ